MPDLKTNMELETGIIKCHNIMDLELTPWGDLALTTDTENMVQKIIIWSGTPPGERLDPNTGSPWYNKQHKRSSDSELRSLASVMKYSLEYHFPEFEVKQFALSRLDASTLYASVSLGNNALKFLFTEGDIIELNKNVWSEFNNNALPRKL